MKRLFVAVFIISNLLYFQIIAQNFYAGQTSGSNVVYINISDIILSPGMNQTVSESFDIDNDGSDDLSFWAGYGSYMGGYTKNSSINIFGATEVCYDSDTTSWVERLLFQDTITHNILWYNWAGSGCLRYEWQFYDPPYSGGSQGIFTGYGYMAFKIETENDTLLGWFYLKVSAGFIRIYEYAYTGTYVGEKENNFNDFQLNFFPNPTNNFIDVIITQDIEFSNLSYSIQTINGVLVKHDKIHANKFRIELDNYSKGILFLIIRDNENILEVKKIVKL